MVGKIAAAEKFALMLIRYMFVEQMAAKVTIFEIVVEYRPFVDHFSKAPSVEAPKK